MEFFTTPWMELFFEDQADKYRFTHLAGGLICIPYMACVDEFQHRVFASPDAGASQRRKIWHEIEKIYLPWRDYDTNAFLSEGGFWMQKQHIFLYPFYYIDYALAGREVVTQWPFIMWDSLNHEQGRHFDYDPYVAFGIPAQSVTVSLLEL